MLATTTTGSGPRFSPSSGLASPFWKTDLSVSPHDWVLVRAIGPALANFGVTGFLADPALTVYSGSTAIASNDNWLAADAATTWLPAISGASSMAFA